MLDTLSQIIGIAALCVTIICYQFNDQKKILIMQIIASVLFMTNLALRDAMAGALLNIHGICRALVFYQRGRRKWADSPLWAVFFSVLAIVCVAVTWQSPLDILPAVGTIFTTAAYYMTDPKWIRRLTLPSPPMWFVYHLSSMNIGGVCNEIFVTVSIITAMIRYDFRKDGGNDAQSSGTVENSK
ncbi:MAG: YgjV family protein [Clostridia bacterium]|nr:YgjV family protein [Clostridia bacterium]MBQ8370194.1 YgjV family protein [Clostridia bacterium]MBQ8513224.1 YgjV family protein [Clostridia bacterium]